MGRFPYEEGTANQKQAQGDEAARTGLRESPEMPRESYILSARCGQEGHQVLGQSDKPSLSASPAGEKQVRIDVQTRVLVKKHIVKSFCSKLQYRSTTRGTQQAVDACRVKDRELFVQSKK